MTKTLLALLPVSAFTASAAHIHTAACNDITNPSEFSITLDEIKSRVKLPITKVNNLSSESTVVVDLMAFYQPSYEQKMGLQWVHQRIHKLVDNTNTGLANSGIPVTIRLVNVQAISGISDDLHYSSKEDGQNVVRGAGSLASSQILNPYENFPENKIYEDMGADLALYIRDYNLALQPENALGFGSLAGELTTVFDTATLPETDWLYPQGEYVLAHEVGHNFNAGHLKDDGGFTFLPAAHAYTCGGRTTIMGPADPNGHRFFSSPEKTINGEVCGVTGTADNTSVIKEYAPLAAQRRNAPSAKGSVFFTEQVYSYTAGESSLTVTIKRDGDLSEAASVQIGLLNGSAKAGKDFTDTASRITFEAGQDTATFSFPVNTSATGKAAVVIRYPYKLTIANQDATVLFTDEVPGVFGFSATAYNAAENAGSVNLTINRTGGSDGTRSVRVYTEDGSRKAGVDYVALDSIISFDAGQTSKPVTISLIDNSIVDTNGTFKVNMTTIDGSDIDTTAAEVTVTLTNNDIATPPGNGADSKEGSGGGSFGQWVLGLLFVATWFRRRPELDCSNNHIDR